MRHLPRSLVIGLVVVGVGCERAPAPRRTPLVVASFYPLYEFARQVAGDRAEVVTLIPTGVEPHDWEPSPRDVARVRQASVFAYNGAALEPWAEALVKDLGGAGPALVNATEGLPLLPADGSGPDPHVWLDPVLAQAQVEAIRAGLAKADPAQA